MLKDYFSKKVENAIKLAIKDNKLGQMDSTSNFSLPIETPKNTQFGDFAVNVSSLARFAKIAPPQIAAVIADYIEKDGFDINIVAGFINFKLGNTILNNVLKDILTLKKDFAKNNLGKNEKVMIEYVSANPT